MKSVIVNGIAPFLEISYDDPNDGALLQCMSPLVADFVAKIVEGSPAE
jgi:hypothetical protein